MNVPVLFVDDEEDIRFSFQEYFEDRFPVSVAGDGAEALEILRHGEEIGVVVTDIRMPAMDGLELIRASRSFTPDLGFIVVSGHGEMEQIVEAMRLGARNFLRKPYELEELGLAIQQEARRYQLLKDDRERKERDRYSEQFLTAVEGLTYALPNELHFVNSIALRLARLLEVIGICQEEQGSSVALALIEIITNAVEHGNLGISGEEKVALQAEGPKAYPRELERRKQDPTYRDRSVRVTATMNPEQAVFFVEDEGAGFDFAALPDPTDPRNLFLPSGRGILLARAFLDEVTFLGKGNVVRLVKKKGEPPS